MSEMDRSWPDQSQEPGIQSGFPTDESSQATRAITCCLSGCLLAENGPQEWGWDLNPDTAIGDAGNPSNILAPRPNIRHISEHLSRRFPLR